MGSFISRLFADVDPYLWIWILIRVMPFLVAVLVEYLVLVIGFRFTKQKRFLATLMANTATALISTVPMIWIMIALSLWPWLYILAFIITVFIEFLVWKRLIDSEENHWTEILLYVLLANLISYAIGHGGFYFLWTIRSSSPESMIY